MTRPASGDPFFDKGLPSNPEAERSILGAILLDNTVCNQAIELLRREDFFLDSHRRIYDKMVALTERGMPIDLITLTDELRRAAEFEQIGGATYIASLIDGVPRTDTIEHYAKIVKQKAMLRRLITASNQIIARAFDEEDDPDIIIDQAEQMIFQIAEDRVRQGFQYIGDVAQRRLEQIEQMAGRPEMITGVPTGFTDFDQMTSGLQRQDLVIIAARPSMGKCLRFDSEIVLSDGRVATIEEICRAREAEVLTLGSNFKFQLTEVGGFLDDGIKPTFRVTTRLGRFIECTLTHPFLTVEGWQSLGKLTVGTSVAMPRRMPIFGQGEMRPCEAKILGYLIGDGCITRKVPAFYAANLAVRSDFEDALSEFGGVKAHHLKKSERIVGLLIVKDGMRSNAPNPLRIWLEELSIYGKNSHQKFIPAPVFTLKRELVALFLNRLFATDGWASVLASGPVQLGYATVSEKLARQVQHLLLRFGVIAKLKRRSVKYKDERRGAWQLDITDALSIKTFISEIGIFGKEEVLERALEALEAKKYQSNCDLIPMAVWDQIAISKGNESWSHLSRRAGIQGHTNIHVGRRQPTRQRLRTLATALHDEQLYNLATSEIYWDEITSIEFVGDKQVYDLTIPETHNFVANDICVHNTALALNMAQYAAKNGHTIGIFSLEMSAEQLVSRLLCSEARVDAHRLRTGYLNREEWARLADALRRLTETQIYIDDTAGVGVLEMRAKTRRLKAERGLDMLIIDYLQLMSGRGRIESRQQEVSQISRDLKGLAKELDVPVIALSQLSRAPEQRSEHKPQLSDLRECVTGNTLLIDAETGLLVPINKLEAGRQILALGGKQKIDVFTVDDVWSTGRKPIYEVKTRTNRSIRATANHPFLTPYGWKRLEELQEDDLIATALRLPFHGTEKSERAGLCRFLGYMTGDGTSLRHREVGFISADEKVFADVKHLVTKHFPEVEIKRKNSPYFECNFVKKYENGYGKPGGNPLREWLKQVGAFGKRDSEKRVPDWVLEAGLIGAREFLAGYFATDGCVQLRHKGAVGRVDIRFDTTSRLLAEDVRHLLLRLGIASTISSGYLSKKATKPIYRVSIVGAENMALFARTVPVIGAKAILIKEAERILRTRAITNPGLLALPRELSTYLHSVAPGWRDQGKKMRRETCSRWAEKLEDRMLEEWGNSDLLWEEIADIAPAGEDEVFDIRVLGAHNFIANGIVAHNSGAIEQDADVVCFIYREELYNQTEENRGKAELIVAKQRNGPTGSVEIAFLKEFTRFENMWRE